VNQNVVVENKKNCKEGTDLRRRRRRSWKGSCGGKEEEERGRNGLWI